ncbi:sugar phosphate isomerase/epimerase [Spirosoma luteolum]
MTLNRRLFLQQAGALTAGAALLPAALRASSATITKPGLQLYSLRDDMEKDARGTLKKVAAMGYKEIESYPGSQGFLWGMSPTEFSGYLKELGLTPISTHTGLAADMEKAIADAAAAGFQKLVVSSIPEDRRQSMSGFRKVADEFNRLGEQTQKAGLQFGYHNHDYPFTELEGLVPYDTLVRGTDPKLVTFELDIFWVIAAGKDPITYFNKYPGRYTMAHIKDRDAKDPKVSTVVGKGNLKMGPILAAAKRAGVEHFFVEVEQYGTLTPSDSVKQSLAGVKKLVF